MATDTPTAARVERFRFTPLGEEAPVAAPLKIIPAKKEAAPAADIEPPAPPPPPPAPVFSEKDIQAAKEAGFAEGHSKGHAEAEAKAGKENAAREEAMRGLLEVIANRITLAAEAHTTYVKGQEQVMGKLVLAVARKLTGETLKANPTANVEALLHECMGLISGIPKVTITVSTTRSVDLKRRIDSIKSRLQGFEGEIVVEENETMGPDDCRVEWKDGHAEYNAENLWKAIETIIAQKTITTTEN
jgi:flagellar assembly protein FliH